MRVKQTMPILVYYCISGKFVHVYTLKLTCKCCFLYCCIRESGTNYSPSIAPVVPLGGFFDAMVYSFLWIKAYRTWPCCRFDSFIALWLDLKWIICNDDHIFVMTTCV